MTIPAVFEHRDVVFEILRFLEKPLSLRAACKPLQEFTDELANFFLRREFTKRYLDKGDFRALINSCVRDPSKQLVVQCNSLARIGPIEEYCEWKAGYAKILAGVVTIELGMPWKAARTVPWHSLQHLRLVHIEASTAVCRVNVLGELPHLHSLYLAGETVDLRGIGKLRNLQVLQVETHEELSNGRELATLPKLNKLDLYLGPIGEFQPPSNLIDLLIVSSFEQNFSCLAELTSLVKVEIYTLSGDYSALSKCKNLESISLRECDIRDISPLLQFPKLKQLSFTGFFPDFLTTDYSPLTQMASLEELDLGDSNFADISILKNLPNLRTLEIPRSRVKDISCLPEFPALESVDLSGLAIKSFEPLERCPRLVRVSGAPFTRQSS